jgi:hypothetical protein
MRTSIRKRTLLGLAALAAICAFTLPAAAGEEGEVVELVEGTAVLLDIHTNTGTGGGGNGGNAKVASSATNIFAPAVFVDYKRFGGEPTVTVDRYPFLPGTPVGNPQCPPTASAPCPPKDIMYQSAPQGVLAPRYSQFWKSDDQGRSFRKSQQFPIHGLEQTNLGGGGGDSYQAVGELTHFVYFVDLTLAPGITMNVSEDLGETWRSDAFGAGLSFLDDRQWVEADEVVNRIYVSTINLINPVTPALVSIENTTGWPTPLQLTEGCNPATYAVGSPPASAAAPAGGATPCPDPADQFLWVAGPVVADNEGTPTRPPSHNVYIPFIRRIASDPLGTGIFGIDEWQLWVAKSTDRGQTWTRHLVAIRPPTNNPANIFPQLTIDRAGNLYYTWSETQGGPTQSTQKNRGKQGGEEEFLSTREQDVFYAFSTTAGAAWSQPINLTKERGDSAVFPWMVAGDAGQVDLTYYKANTGINSNIAFVDSEGNECEDPDEPGCRPNPSVWNVYFAQSQNALNTGPNFNSVQVTTQPNHIGQICTAGLACEGDRDLLDFFTIDVDSLGAATIAYSDDNRRRASDTQDYNVRQISGNSVFWNTTINLMNDWGIRNHSVTDRAGDVTNTASAPIGPCPGMDVLAMSAVRRDDLITVNLTLNGPPTAANAVACGNAPPNPLLISTTGGLWGVEFWAASDPTTTGPSNRFYIAYRDNPPDGPPNPRVEGGTMDHVNVTVTALEFNSRTLGTLGGNCFATPPPAGTCTISMTVNASSLGISPGNALNNMTGLSAYLFGNLEQPIPATRLILGNSEQADATASINYLGSGTP